MILVLAKRPGLLLGCNVFTYYPKEALEKREGRKWSVSFLSKRNQEVKWLLHEHRKLPAWLCPVRVRPVG